jgi:hypothetical protein
MAELHLAVSEYHVIGVKAGGEPELSSTPVGAFHAAVPGNTRAVCRAPVTEVLDRPWPPATGGCGDCLAELAPRPRTET